MEINSGDTFEVHDAWSLMAGIIVGTIRHGGSQKSNHDTEQKTKLEGGVAAMGTVHGGGLCETESIFALNLSGCPPLKLHETVWFPGANKSLTPDER
ncbi:hypothetical protein K0M31_005745 [Melipona bicolor]|uniref:Uncharacterized protein n=1 Tax=Melipona bicolor TaxID=60889 RepID=A0AA40FUB2_9HYME|nr:hypothetical protein K0M31_005745 [Melipona bicolor]